MFGMRRPWVARHVQIDLKDATFTIKDGGSNSITMRIGEGNLTHTESREIQYIPNRGKLDEVTEGNEQPVELSFDLIWDFLRNDGSTGVDPTPYEAIKGTGAAASWTSSDADTCRPYAIDIEVLYQPSCSSTKQERITFDDFRHESIDSDIRAATLSCSGRCNITEPTIVRETNTG